jgi:hypothetical protein
MEMATEVKAMEDYQVQGRGGMRKFNRGYGRGHYYYFNCWKDDHISSRFPNKG